MDEKDVVEVNYVEEKENSQEVPEEGKKKWWNKKRAIKVISISLVAVLLLSVGIAYFAPKVHWYYLDQKYFDGKDPDYTDMFHVVVKSEYNSEAARGEITEKDFNWENIERIELKKSLVGNYFYVYIKKRSVKEIKKAIIHCKKLYFVEYADFGKSWMEFLAIR